MGSRFLVVCPGLLRLSIGLSSCVFISMCIFSLCRRSLGTEGEAVLSSSLDGSMNGSMDGSMDGSTGIYRLI